jgi:hypothetical protein
LKSADSQTEVLVELNEILRLAWVGVNGLVRGRDKFRGLPWFLCI